MDHINHQNAPQSGINTSYSTGYGNGRRAVYAKSGKGQKNNTQAQNLLQRLDAIDERRQYKPSLYELFNQMDANAIISFNLE